MWIGPDRYHELVVQVKFYVSGLEFPGGCFFKRRSRSYKFEDYVARLLFHFGCDRAAQLSKSTKSKKKSSYRNRNARGLPFWGDTFWHEFGPTKSRMGSTRIQCVDSTHRRFPRPFLVWRRYATRELLASKVLSLNKKHK